MSMQGLLLFDIVVGSCWHLAVHISLQLCYLVRFPSCNLI